MAVTFFLKLAFIAFCVVGCLYQVHHIKELYFQYESTLEVTHRRPLIVELPAISICFYPHALVNLDKVAQSLPELQQTLDNLKSNQSLSESVKIGQLKRIKSNLVALKKNTIATCDSKTMAFSDLVDSCQVLSPLGTDNQTKYVDCLSITQVQVYFVHSFKCFMLFKPQDKPHLVDSSRATADKLLTLKGKFSIDESMVVYLDSRNDILVNNIHNWLTLDFSYYRFIRLGYKKTVLSLLPPPFDTDCKNFGEASNWTFTSRIDCVRKCMISTYQEMVPGIWPSTVPAPSTVNLKQDYKRGRNNSNIEKLCIDACENREDCHRELISIKGSWKIRRERAQANQTSELEILIQKGLEIKKTYHPKLSQVGCFSNVASAVSLWFGFSVLTVTHNRVLRNLKARLMKVV